MGIITVHRSLGCGRDKLDNLPKVYNTVFDGSFVLNTCWLLHYYLVIDLFQTNFMITNLNMHCVPII